MSTDADIYKYLWSRGCDTPDDWALENGYVYNKREDIWYNDEGQPVDLETEILNEMEPNK